MIINAIVASRMTSTRLPGKIMMDLCGKPALVQLVNRLKSSKYLNQIVIATTLNDQDDIVEDTAKQLHIPYYRGSEEDVLKRYVEAAVATDTEMIVLITSDCPVLDVETVDRVIERMIEHPYLDYVTNQMFLTYPLGFGVEVFRTSTLQSIEQLTQDPSDREHVSLYLYERPEQFHLSNVEAPYYLRHPEYRLTLDTIEDYELINHLYEAFYPTNPSFSLYDIVKYFQLNPDLLKINQTIQQKKARD
jgi:spore coat polysaccharide biosynthesis protein SpsF